MSACVQYRRPGRNKIQTQYRPPDHRRREALSGAASLFREHAGNKRQPQLTSPDPATPHRQLPTGPESMKRSTVSTLIRNALLRRRTASNCPSTMWRPTVRVYTASASAGSASETSRREMVAVMMTCWVRDRPTTDSLPPRQRSVREWPRMARCSDRSWPHRWAPPAAIRRQAIRPRDGTTEPEVAESVGRDALVQGDQRDTGQRVMEVGMCGVGDAFERLQAQGR